MAAFPTIPKRNSYRSIAFGCLLVLATIVSGKATARAAQADLHVPNTCGVADNPVLSSGRVNAAPWQAEFTVEHTKGLVFRNVMAGQRHFLPGLRVPHLVLNHSVDGVWKPVVIQFCADRDRHSGEPELTHGGRRLIWWYEKRLSEGQVRGTLRITYVTKFGSEEPRCAGGMRMTAGSFFTRKCFRFIPLVNYSWTPDNPGVVDPEPHVTAFIRFDYGAVGISPTSDYNYFFNSSMTSGLAPILRWERAFTAVTNGKAGEFDNIHTALPRDGQRTVIIPGCRVYGMDCVHMHWRWSGALAPPTDPLTEPYTGQTIPEAYRGEAYLTPGQTIEIIVAADKGEGDVRFPRELLKNRDLLATVKRCAALQGNRDVYLEEVHQRAVVWYVATAHGSNNWFMRHGLFALERLKRTIENPSVGALLDNILEWRRTATCDPMTSSVIATRKKGQ